jgi:hypothetical protein
VAINVDDTLTPRNGASFPVVSGVVQLKGFVFAQLPLPSTLPPGTLVAVTDQNYQVYKNSGTSWDAVGSSSPVLAALLNESMAAPTPLPFPGAQVGQRLVAAFGVTFGGVLADQTSQFETHISVANQIQQLHINAPLTGFVMVFIQ